MNNFKQFIQEKWLSDLKNKDLQNKSFGKAFKVYDNPTAADLADILKDSYGSPDVRVLINVKTGEVYAFNAQLIHATVIDYLKLDPKFIYKGIGIIKQGKIRLGQNREFDRVLLNNPPFNYSDLYYDNPEKAFEMIKQNCKYMYNKIFYENSVDALLKYELYSVYK
jgi:hypothetical protein